MISTSTRQPSRVSIIGLIGGIASGKSFVAQELLLLKCAVIDADRTGHEVLQHPEVVAELTQAFGADLLDASGQVDRRRISALVFADGPEAVERRRKLEHILHPRIRSLVEQKILLIRKSATPPKAIIVDAPLLVEAGWAPMCDYIFFVDTPAEIRLQRCLARGWTQQQWSAREAAQTTLDLKRRSATHFIDGTLDPTRLKLRLRELIEELSKRRIV